MSTRGYIGIKKNGVIKGKYNHSDSYYSQLGKEVVEAYFDGNEILELGGDEPIEDNADGKNIFLYDGLFCEYGYVHNKDEDTLEVYRGFFERQQVFEQHEISVGEKKYYVHLVMVIDRKIHSKELVLEAMAYYDKYKEKANSKYPERRIINCCDFCFKNIPIGRKYCNKKCRNDSLVRDI